MLSQELRESHARLSAAALRFLEFVDTNPRCRRRLNFIGAGLPDWILLYPFAIQSWPTFLGGSKLREAAEIAPAICRLIKSIPERFFERDAERIASFYGLPLSSVQEILSAPEGAERALARGDFIDTESGLQCLEMNLSAKIGGWEFRFWADAYCRCDYVAEFLDREHLRVLFRDPFRILIEHVAEQAAGSPEIDGEELNLALISPKDLWGPYSPWIVRAFDLEYGESLALRHGRGGRFLCCGYEELRDRDGKIFAADGRRIHVVLEYDAPWTPAFIVESCKRHQIHLYNGPMTRLWGDKRNLALLSEYQDSGLFEPAEEELLRRHLPWTRLVASEFAEHAQERVFLPEFLLARRESLVLKHGWSAGGEAVLLGRAMPAERWCQAVDKAIAEGGWIVQEEVRPLRRLYQWGESGSKLHDVIWGLFVFGDRYGGAFLRMLPSDQGGIVNTAQGATEAIVFEVEEA